MIFTIPVTTRVEDFDQNGLLTPPALLSIFENTAVRHANTVGYSPMADSLQNGMSWVITNWRAAVLRAPRLRRVLPGQHLAVRQPPAGHP